MYSSLISITAVTEVFGDGQKLIAAALEYDNELYSKDLSPDYFQAAGREIISAYAADSPRGRQMEQGRFVILRLNADDATAGLSVILGQGPHGRTALKKAEISVSQKQRLTTVSGGEIRPFANIKNSFVDEGVAAWFKTRAFINPANGQSMNYNIYLPKHYDPKKRYPLVLFIHDAGSCSDEARATLAQGLGAIIWARPEEQAKRPCIVVAPHYTRACANDDFEVTWEAEATINLLKEIINEYSVDSRRIYGTGQSMGCMMLCELSLRHPDFFAACLLVAGQWNPETMAGAKEQNFWTVVARGDAKAYPIMSACYDAMKKAGGLISRKGINGKQEEKALNEVIKSQEKEGCHLYFTYFEGKSILPGGAPDFPGSHHVYTWRRAYGISALREWLFAQRR